MGYFGPYFMILVQPTSKVVFNALKSVTTFDLISYDHQSPYVRSLLQKTWPCRFLFSIATQN